MTQCIILAGGLGTRVQSITNRQPKCLIPFNGKPFLWHQLKLLEKNHIEEIILCLGYGHEHVLHFLTENSEWPFKISISSDGPVLRGTGGALLNAVQTLDVRNAFIVLYGDSYLPVDFQQIWRQSENGRLPLMTVHRQLNHATNNVLIKDGYIIKYSKNVSDWTSDAPTHIDYGLTVLQKKCFTMEKNIIIPFDLSVILSKIIKQKQLRALEITESYFEIGSFSGIEQFQKMLDRMKNDVGPTLDNSC